MTHSSIAATTRATALGFVCLVALAAGAADSAHAQSQQDRIDAIFARWDTDTSPGCAVGVDRAGEPLVRRAYGMADLEWDIENTPQTIFENGSVSKQFTAGAVVLLALEGKLSLEDDVRDYVPELPDYPQKITLRHMLNHTSGLRDWGAVAGIEGWGRSQRTHNHDHVLDILGKQTALNFPPGHEYSYSNSGYNLLAVVVSRVSGMSFAQFSKERIFEPLGMTSTQWRDDYTRIVPGRSSAYTAEQDGGFSINRPIEHVHGNGGLLTTVGDLLLWNHALDEGSLAGPEFVEMMETQGVLNDGRTIAYALGLTVGERWGLRTVSHGGATSGYRAGLIRFPDQQVSAAVLCNVTNANGVGLAMSAAEVYMADMVVDSPEPEMDWPTGARVTAASLEARVGRYISSIRPANVALAMDDEGRLRMGGPGGAVLIPRSDSEFEIGREAGGRLLFGHTPQDGRSGFEVWIGETMIDAFIPAGDWEPAEADLDDFAGLFHSDDAATSLTVTVEDGGLVLHHPVRGTTRLRPIAQDTFQGGLGVVRFRRLTGGIVHELSVTQSRVYDMRFRRTH